MVQFRKKQNTRKQKRRKERDNARINELNRPRQLNIFG
jgi:hypothetical protein